MLNRAFIKFTLGFVVILIISFGIMVITSNWVKTNDSDSKTEIIMGEVKI